ncbi:N-acetylmuramic acid 6-phosphate etherase [Paenisporosarcina quisquiliarum]|uniref:N-acetylmuramic acid 6-phosphate etherase n=1 Tax=Paenisporosarcina quisquiliarum TaxID=365346 RepID=A0A9X3LG67_9BACL|nr:N-acetylmuramic acid 6-phosphate etherase [Paenisporosarcina quisquiliarum]MCZ8537367.1 N-acetylmuramic acid 6-phosphate etherase [Paenisporosarcina quisquiliarum]
MEKLSLLTTEEFNPKSQSLDEMSIKEILTTMNEEDQTIALAVQRVIPTIEETIEKVVTAFKNGGRLIYIGAGTSGRIGVLDAVECPPTFSTSPELVQAVLAGGEGAMFQAVEGAEDDELLGASDLQKLEITEHDVIIGIAASGRTPYVKGALVYANSCGATTVSLTSNENSTISNYADIKIEVVTGPEVLTGSTRLRAATAHKMILNMISTASMIKTGKVYKNLMVDLNASNYKLRERAKQMVCSITDVSYKEAEAVLEETAFDVKLAIVMIFTNVDKSKAQQLIAQSGGFVRDAVKLAEIKEG